jgi:hypothetical protein
MSKQLKLKFKKILKQADFTHADLEYHEELLPEAKQQFAMAITEIINELSPEDKKRMREADDNRQRDFEKKLDIKRAQEETRAIDEEQQSKETSMAIGDSKEAELKSIFRRIAALTHPDKAFARGISNVEKLRLEKIFMRAKKAYEDKSWYILHSIAFDLNIELPDPDQDNIDWVEEDIQNTLTEIARVAGTMVWVWYNGDEAAKMHAIKCYFQQSYGLEIVDTND